MKEENDTEITPAAPHQRRQARGRFFRVRVVLLQSPKQPNTVQRRSLQPHAAARHLGASRSSLADFLTGALRKWRAQS